MIWLLMLFVVAVLAAGTLGANDGLVSIYWSPWRIDLSLNLFLLLLLVSGFALHAAVGAVYSLIGLPERARLWRTERRASAAQAALREAQAFLLAGRYGRAHKAARRAVELQAQTEGLDHDAEFGALAHLLAAASLHRLQDRAGRDEQLARVEALIVRPTVPSPVAEGASLLAAEWAIDDRQGERALEQLLAMPAGVARRTHALRLRLQAARLARQPLEALRAARLLAKHQGFTPAAAEGLLRSLAVEAIDSSRDADQLRRIWQQLEPADRRDALVAARAAERAALLEAPADARGWLRPHWENIVSLGERERLAIALAFVEVLDGLPADWLALLEKAVTALPNDPAIAYAVGCAMAQRQLWGRARRLLETAAQASGGEPALRRRAWQALARMAEYEGDTEQAQRCYKEAAQNA
jgi:HemY protein